MFRMRQCVVEVVVVVFQANWKCVSHLARQLGDGVGVTRVSVTDVSSRSRSRIRSRSRSRIRSRSYAKTRDLILSRSCYADAGETELA